MRQMTGGQYPTPLKWAMVVRSRAILGRLFRVRNVLTKRSKHTHEQRCYREKV